MKRSEISSKDKWDLSSIYKNDEAWYEEYKDILPEVDALACYTDLMETPERLLEFLENDEKVSRVIEKLYTYAHMNNDADTSLSSYQKMYGEAKDLYSKYSSVTSYVNPLLLNYDYNLICEYYKKVPKLKDYDKLFKEVFRYKPHTLSEEEEKILSSLSNVFSNPEDNYTYLTDADIKFGNIIVDGKEVELTESNYSVYLSSKDRAVRKQAFERIFSTYGSYINSIASMMNGNVEVLTTLAKLKKYNSSLEASLFNEEIDPTVYDTLIDTVSKHLDVLFKYYEAKKDMLGLDELHLYDTYVNVVKESDKLYSFDEAKDLVIKATAILGSDYTKNLSKAFDEHWIDIYPNDSKRGGAYSGGTYDTKPFVLLNYEGRYNDVSTLAHELGHSMHSYLTRSNNPYITGDYKIFVAEVASTVNELLLAKYMLKNSKNPEEKLSILSELMGLYKATIFRQVMFAEFERIIHSKKEQGIVLTGEEMCDIYYKLNKKYFGDKVVVDDLIKYEWMRIPHFYYNFYVYKYAIGLSCATKIVNDILSGKEHAREKYLDFLKTGGSMYPALELMVAGVSVFDEKVYEEAINTFALKIKEFKENL